MTGSLQIKNGIFYIVTSEKEEGKWKHKWVSTGLTAKGNKRKAEELLRQYLGGGIVTPVTDDSKQKTLFTDYVNIWLKVAKLRVDETTYQGYVVTANAQVISWFKERSLAIEDLTFELLQEYFDEKASNGRVDGSGGLSNSSLKKCKNIINQTCKLAVKRHLIPTNPCNLIELGKKTPHTPHFYTVSQVKDLFNYFEGDILLPIIKIAVVFGLRRSELLGLRWDCVDFESGMLTIRRTVSRVNKIVDKDKTKNASSRRSDRMSDEVIGIFKGLKAEENINRKDFGSAYIEDEHVFKWPNGEVIKPDYVTVHFREKLKKSNLPKITFHELRHSCASMLLCSGYTLKDVQEYMGHSDIQTTANIYGHLDNARKEVLTSAMSGSLLG